MTSYVRRLVSGAKARFTDPTTALELDLVYVTPRVIIMGFPAQGLEGLYRNRRADVVKFLSTHHASSFWVWNLCPLGENGYDDEVFGGRVSRWPWPDHHAPPLAYLPLIAKEMKLWLDGGADRVAVIHCKAGKGRSGTVACSYLLFDPPVSNDSDDTKHEDPRAVISKKTTGDIDKIIDDVPTLQDDDADRIERTGEGEDESLAPSIKGKETPKNTTPPNNEDSTPTIRMQSTSEDLTSTIDYEDSTPTTAKDFAQESAIRQDTTSTAGPASTSLLSRPVSLASTHRPASAISTRASVQSNATDATGDALPTLKDAAKAASASEDDKANPTATLQRVLALHTARRMKPTGKENPKQGVSIPSQRRWLHYWAKVLEGKDEGWLDTRTLTPASPKPARIRITSLTLRMYPPPRLLRGAVTASFARYDEELLSKLDGHAKDVLDTESTDFTPARSRRVGHELFDNEGRWDRGKMVRRFAEMRVVENGKSESEGEEGKIVTYKLGMGKEGEGVEVDARREVRVKVYMGQAFLFWTWFVPVFEMPSEQEGTHEMDLPRKSLDFPVGLGKWVLDTKLKMEWVR